MDVLQYLQSYKQRLLMKTVEVFYTEKMNH